MTLRADFANCTSDLTVRHGWGLDGPGPARFGWWSVHPHRVRWLGRTRADVVARRAVLALYDREIVRETMRAIARWHS